MLAGGGRTLTGRERDGEGGGTVAGRPAAGSGSDGPTAFDGMMFVISSSPTESAGGRIADEGGELRFTYEMGFPPSLAGV